MAARRMWVDPMGVRIRVPGPAYRRGMSDQEFARACRELRGEPVPLAIVGVDYAAVEKRIADEAVLTPEAFDEMVRVLREAPPAEMRGTLMRVRPYLPPSGREP